MIDKKNFFFVKKKIGGFALTLKTSLDVNNEQIVLY